MGSTGGSKKPARSVCFDRNAAVSLIGGILIYATLPPLHLGFLIVIAIVPWMWLVLRAEGLSRRDYFWIWIAGCLLWLGVLQGIRLAYWPLYAGWVVLSLYLAVYCPLFVGLSRVAHHRWQLPLPLATAIVWMGLELIRGYAFTGFSGALLAHTLSRYPIAIQIADQVSVYGIGGLIVAFNAVIAQWFNPIESSKVDSPSRKHPWVSTVVVVILTSIALLYGAQRIAETDEMARSQKPLLRVALIQENAETMFEATEESRLAAWQRYASGTRAAVAKFPNLDLIVWPESVYGANEPLIEDNSKGEVPGVFKRANFDAARLNSYLSTLKRFGESKAESLIRSTTLPEHSPSHQKPQVIVGTNLWRVEPDHLKSFNVALWLGPDAKPKGIYTKTHLVMFGEYVPLWGFFGLAYQLFGLEPAIPGDRYECFNVNGVRVVPSICFESMVPQLLAAQVRQLSARGETPDLLLNITNDGWFRGSSILDLHVAGATLSAVENRRPILVAANTGISLWIDGAGRVIQRGERLQSAQILAEPYRDNRFGLFQWTGDRPFWALCFVCGLLAISGFRSKKKQIAIA